MKTQSPIREKSPRRGNRSSCIAVVAAALAVALGSALPAVAQTEYWEPYAEDLDKFEAESLFVGFSFFYLDDSKEIDVYHHNNDAGCKGALYFMAPGSDSAHFLFYNKGNGEPHPSVRITDLFSIPESTEVFFMYTIVDGSCCGCTGTRYTGQNRPGIDPYVTGISGKYGRRWAVGGRIKEGGQPTDTVEFAFEDLTDFDFTDIIFHVSGLVLNVEMYPDSIEIDVFPSDTVEAGQTVTLIGAITNQQGEHDPSLSKQIIWRLDNKLPEDPDITPAVGDTVYWTPTEAFHRQRIIGEIEDQVNGRILYDTLYIYVKPGPPDHLVVEGAPDGETASPRNDNPVGGNGSITLGSSQTSRSVYAVVRDEFGNFIELSQSTRWDTLSPTGIVSAAIGDPSEGEGIIAKLGPTDTTTRVRAVSLDYAGLSDIVSVTVEDVEYDSLRIGVLDGGAKVPIASLDMLSTQDTTLVLQARRKDRLGGNNGWIDIAGNWSMTGSLTSDVGPPTASITWSFEPSDTGSGKISASLAGVQDPAEISVIVRPGGPQSLVLYPKSGQPDIGQNQPFADQADVADTVTAGEGFDIYANLFDINDVWLSDYASVDSLADDISWEIIADGGVSLANTSGASTTVNAEKAWQTIKVVASYKDVAADTVTLYVKPGAPHHLVIEASGAVTKLNQDDSLKTTIIPENETTRYVYAVIRDQYGNFVELSDSTQWTSTDVNIVTVAAGQTQAQGLITRQTTSQSQTTVTAASLRYSGLQNTITVMLLDIFYSKLRIRMGDGSEPENDSIVMNTNQDTTLIVQGFRSDGGGWEDVPAEQWAASLGLEFDPPPPSLAHSWRFSPTRPDTGGFIFVTLGTATPDTVWVRFDPGPPTGIDIDLITPPDQRIAGQPIQARITLTNRDGVVPGTWCGSALFDDTLESVRITEDGDTLVPAVIIDGDTIPLDSAVEMCFTDGIDTVELLFYTSPENETPHFTTVDFTDPVFDTTISGAASFVLKPGPVARIELVEQLVPLTPFN
ncbi:MAG: hypothetical protein GF418_05660, partial [Chitinivibrionales bacterium]|nr:hypothetical protein [Chitinivibrionales bacterium]MBD3395097.1 hypothetical protein [Chitinivibrionales bacterium]